MNDYKNNWFYKESSKHSRKDIVFIVVGMLLFLVGIVLFFAFLGVMNMFLVLFGSIMTVLFGMPMFILMPKLKKQMERMSADDFASLGDYPPQPYYYQTFYFTERYLCAPSAMKLIRYDRIKGIPKYHARLSKSGHPEVYVTFDFNDGRRSVSIDVKDCDTFMRAPADFAELVQQHIAAMEQQNRMF